MTYVLSKSFVNCAADTLSSTFRAESSMHMAGGIATIVITRQKACPLL
jgi:hypothetical protein|tara:strand:- start:230 stop:373 length:144 start_codon:yes stop_codon:yes gene_type:complete